MQQTRISQGLGYYHRFVSAFPTVGDLAIANEEEVLKVWQGLGYYSRARNLHSSAQKIYFEYKGQFPERFSDWRKLKGVGDYTAAAIASIVYNEAVPSIDGNIYRVMSRLFASNESIYTSNGKKYYFELGVGMIDQENPGDFNQALMDLGAMICTPKQYKCTACPLEAICVARKLNRVNDFPLRKIKEANKVRFFYYIVLDDNSSVCFRKRIQNDIWKNLFDFPLVESTEELNLEQLFNLPDLNNILNGCETTLISYSNEFKHILSHQTIRARFLHLNTKSMNNLPHGCVAIDKNHIFELAIPKLIERYIREGLHEL